MPRSTFFGIIVLFISCKEANKESTNNDNYEVLAKDSLASDTVFEHEALTYAEDSIMNFYIAMAHKFDTIPADNNSFISDDPEVKNIARPNRTYIKNPKYSLFNFFGVWGGDENEPVSDFRVDKDIFDVADYEGNANMPYILYNDSLIVFYNDFIRNGKIIFSSKDSLVIRWKNFDGNYIHSYNRWE
jgi:hypothetical protein